MHAISMSFMHFRYEILGLQSFSSKCEYMTATWMCTLYSFIVFYSLMGFTLSHMAICFERFIATAKAERQNSVRQISAQTLMCVGESIQLIVSIYVCLTLFFFHKLIKRLELLLKVDVVLDHRIQTNLYFAQLQRQMR
uniref:Uncharacterized protein n=1 Tax=Ditylenchus dipsaci TaxID=166011 RepID=A0A915DIQ4_9BILA